MSNINNKTKEEVMNKLKELYKDFNITSEYKLFGLTIYKHTESWHGDHNGEEKK